MLKTGLFVIVLVVTSQVIYGNETVAEAESDEIATASNGDGASTVSSNTTSSVITSSNRDGLSSDNVETAEGGPVVQSDPQLYESSVLPYGNDCSTGYNSYVTSYQQPTIQETFLTQQPSPYPQNYQPSYSQVQSVSPIQHIPVYFPQQYTSEPYEYRQPCAYYQGYPPSLAANAYQRGFISKPCNLIRNQFC